jgi:hypothetical protein
LESLSNLEDTKASPVIITPESEVIDLTTTDSETFFDAEEHLTSDNDGDVDMGDRFRYALPPPFS